MHDCREYPGQQEIDGAGGGAERHAHERSWVGNTLDNVIVKVLASVMSMWGPAPGHERTISQEVYDMTLVRRASPRGELVSLRQAMDRLFEDSFARPRCEATTEPARTGA